MERLFPNLDQMLRFHSGFNKAMKKRRQESTVIENVGDILITMVSKVVYIYFQINFKNIILLTIENDNILALVMSL